MLPLRFSICFYRLFIAVLPLFYRWMARSANKANREFESGGGSQSPDALDPEPGHRRYSYCTPVLGSIQEVIRGILGGVRSSGLLRDGIVP